MDSNNVFLQLLIFYDSRNVTFYGLQPAWLHLSWHLEGVDHKLLIAKYESFLFDWLNGHISYRQV